MKEIKVGADHYKAKGLVRKGVYIRPSVVRLYEKAAKKRGWSERQFYTYWLTKKAPR